MADLERIELDNGVVVLKLKGSLTSEALEKVEQPFEAITHRPQGKTVVDLTAVEMVTTPALSMFIDAANSARQSGGQVVFTESNPPVRDVLRRLRLHTVLTTVQGLDDAISKIKG